MPSTSKKQRKFMAAAANNPGFAKKAGIPSGVAKDFHAADKRKKKPRQNMIAALTSETKGYA
tara:strand:- start:50 stop:235 length:186 start_codon:yes stop_codon:yes gene_type:complete